MSSDDDHQKLQTAVALHQGGSLKEAADLYRELIDRNPNNFHALHLLGTIEASAGNLMQAKAYMARSLSIEPPNVKFMENYSYLLIQLGDYDSASQVAGMGLEIDGKNPLLLYINAISLFRRDQLKDSLSQFDRLLAIQPNNAIAVNERGCVLAQLRQFDAALTSFDRALALNANYAEAHLNKGNLCNELGRYPEALAAYDKALALTPQNADAWLGRGNVLFWLKRHDQCAVAYDRALALDPQLAEGWLGRGNLFFELRRHDESMAAYDKALALDPNLAEAWLGRGNLLNEMQRADEALAAYEKALALAPDLVPAAIGLGWAHCYLDRDAEAAKTFEGLVARGLRLVEPVFALTCLPSSVVSIDLLDELGRVVRDKNEDATEFENGAALARATALDRSGRHAEAWEHLVSANRLIFPHKRDELTEETERQCASLRRTKGSSIRVAHDDRNFPKHRHIFH